MNESAVELKLSMSDEEAEEVLDMLGLLCGGELIDRFYEIADENDSNPWGEERKYEKRGMLMKEEAIEVKYEISGEGWSCRFTGYNDGSWLDGITGHTAMLMHFVKHGIVDADLALQKLHQLQGNA